jgi:multisubunit Na+/H+ antiporter MnhG subunit
MIYVIYWILTGIVSVLIGFLIDIIPNKEIPRIVIKDIYLAVLLCLIGPVTTILLIVYLLTEIEDKVIFKGKKWY